MESVLVWTSTLCLDTDLFMPYLQSTASPQHGVCVFVLFAVQFRIPNVVRFMKGAGEPVGNLQGQPANFTEKMGMDPVTLL